MSHHRRQHYILVAIDWPAPISTDQAAELVQTALDEAKANGAFNIVHGNGPNPPYYSDCDDIAVFPDERP